MSGPVWAVVVAAGEGRRFGGPKQYAPFGGQRIVDWALAAARAACDGVVLVVPPERAGDPEPAADAVVAGGPTRSASVRAGLAAVPGEAEVVVVHDAARPFATPSLFAAVIAAVRSGADGAVPGVVPADTIKQVAGEVVVATLQRDQLVAVQTPQAFAAGALRAAHAGGGEATDDAALVEAAGGRVVVVAGDPRNRKITTPDDLATAPVPVAGIRVGLGFDVHPFAADQRPLVLGGIRLEGERGLAGHSDADVVAHAVADALLGAVGLGDIGEHFPDTDPRWAGADSMALLAEVVARVRGAGWRPVNVDCAVVLEAPRLAGVRRRMQGRLAEVVGAPVAVKPRRAEGLGALGRGEGVACWAVVLVAQL